MGRYGRAGFAGGLSEGVGRIGDALMGISQDRRAQEEREEALRRDEERWEAQHGLAQDQFAATQEHNEFQRDQARAAARREDERYRDSMNMRQDDISRAERARADDLRMQGFDANYIPSPDTGIATSAPGMGDAGAVLSSVAEGRDPMRRAGRTVMGDYDPGADTGLQRQMAMDSHRAALRPPGAEEQPRMDPIVAQNQANQFLAQANNDFRGAYRLLEDADLPPEAETDIRIMLMEMQNAAAERERNPPQSGGLLGGSPMGTPLRSNFGDPGPFDGPNPGPWSPEFMQGGGPATPGGALFDQSATPSAPHPDFAPLPEGVDPGRTRIPDPHEGAPPVEDDDERDGPTGGMSFREASQVPQKFRELFEQYAPEGADLMESYRMWLEERGG